jgi:hypothetical protein
MFPLLPKNPRFRSKDLGGLRPVVKIGTAGAVMPLAGDVLLARLGDICRVNDVHTDP